ncbi:hypothetical protein HKX48_003332 [Thoreauomyces humboldtii]|nr:hypothetical protein HKX48_003332 [Thoreauomyces humboldtii]
MVDLKARAQRRAQYFKARLGDPTQLLRIAGTELRVYADVQQFQYHESEDNLVKWQGDGVTKIDRFDARQLLDFLPTTTPAAQSSVDEEEEMEEELAFERYCDLIDHARLDKSESEIVQMIDEGWNHRLVQRDSLNESEHLVEETKSSGARSGAAIGYDYSKPNPPATDSTESSDDGDNTDEVPPPPSHVFPVIHQEGLLGNLDQLKDDEITALNEMGQPFGIQNLYRCLRVIKREQEEADTSPNRRRGSESEGDSEDSENSEHITASKASPSAAVPAKKPPAPTGPPVRMTPLERLKLKAQMALEKQIRADAAKQESKTHNTKLQARGLRDVIAKPGLSAVKSASESAQRLTIAIESPVRISVPFSFSFSKRCEEAPTHKTIPEPQPAIAIKSYIPVRISFPFPFSKRCEEAPTHKTIPEPQPAIAGTGPPL